MLNVTAVESKLKNFFSVFLGLERKSLVKSRPRQHYMSHNWSNSAASLELNPLNIKTSSEKLYGATPKLHFR